VLLTITLAAGAAPETAAAPTEAQTSTPQQADEFPLSAEDMANCDYRFELDDAPDVCFPHKSHRRLGCGKCHHQSKAKPLNTPHPEYLTSSWHSCHSCHDPETERQKVYRNCLDCHHANPNSIADETPSSKVALHENCWKCHDKGIGAQASARCPDCHIGKDG
jgi:hypothetical protein